MRMNIAQKMTICFVFLTAICRGWIDAELFLLYDGCDELRGSRKNAKQPDSDCAGNGGSEQIGSGRGFGFTAVCAGENRRSMLSAAR